MLCNHSVGDAFLSLHFSFFFHEGLIKFMANMLLEIQTLKYPLTTSDIVDASSFLKLNKLLLAFHLTSEISTTQYEIQMELHSTFNIDY